MLLGMELGLGPGDFVLNGDPAAPSQKATIKMGRKLGALPPFWEGSYVPI